MHSFKLERKSSAKKECDRKEDDFRFAKCGYCLNKHDSIPFEDAADVLHYAIKTSHASLPSTLQGETIEEKLEDMYKRDAATRYVYITNNNIAYVMEKDEFTNFILIFGRIEKDSQKNGGQKKIRILRESIKMLEWLETALTD